MTVTSAVSVTTGWIPLGEPFAEHIVSITHLVPAVVTGNPVVVCDPFGMDGLASDATLNAIAWAFATSGRPVIRFRPPGLGDASDLPDDASIVPTWRASVDAAITLAKSFGGGRSVDVFGLRLGASLGAEVASQRRDIERVMLWAPVSGKTYCREQRLLRAAGSDSASDTSKGSASLADDGSVEAGGFRLSASSILDLAACDLAKATSLPAARVLVVDRDDRPGVEPLAKRLRDLGGTVDVVDWTGFADMRIDDPESGEIPSSLVKSLVEWLANDPKPQRPVQVTGVEASPVPVVVSRIQLSPLVSEHVVEIASSSVLHAIITEPAHAVAPELPTVVMLSTGANPCGGAGRVHTELARRFARNGVRSIRIDRFGVGVSALHHAACESTPEILANVTAYDDIHLRMLADIERFVRSEVVNQRYVLLGICSGAYAAFNAKRVGISPTAIVSVNQIIFDVAEWEGHVESPIFALKARYQLAKSLRSPKAWLEVLRGEIPLKPALRRLMTYARMRKVMNEEARTSNSNPQNVNAQMRAMASAGIPQLYVFDEDEVGLAYVLFKAGDTVSELKGTRKFSLWTTQGAGHTFGTARSRVWLADAIEQGLEGLGITLRT